MRHWLLHHPTFTVMTFAAATGLLMVRVHPLVGMGVYIATIGLVGTFCMVAALHLERRECAGAPDGGNDG